MNYIRWPHSNSLYRDYDIESTEWLRERQRWLDKQPEYIAAEMTNAEIIQLLKIINGGFAEYLLTQQKKEISCISAEHGGSITVKIINGKLYKKIKNPKIFGAEVIAW